MTERLLKEFTRIECQESRGLGKERSAPTVEDQIKQSLDNLGGRNEAEQLFNLPFIDLNKQIAIGVSVKPLS